MTEQKQLPGKMVTTQYGYIRGISPDDHTWAWYGIPYAGSPVGDLRWKPPVAPSPWTGVREAVDYADQAAQNTAYKPYGLGSMSEDCLYLNITAPKNGTHLPVMVWFHGGAFMVLTGNMKSYNNPAALPTKGVILITVNHRLGPFGYMAHPLLSAESGYGGSGNYGQLDLIAALKWVRDNIAAFGGDPDNVTIFGQSGGGAKTISLMASPLAAGLFNKAICQSGMVASPHPFMNTIDLATAEARGTNLFKRLGTKALADMRAVSWEEIIQSDLEAYADNIGVYGPNIDGYYMEKNLLDAIRSGLAGDVPFIAGATSVDMVSEGDMVPGLIEQMSLRGAHCKAPQYAYKFSHVPAGWRELGATAYHSSDLVYLFKFPASFAAHFLSGLTGLSSAQIGDPDGDGVVASPNDIFISTQYGAEDVVLTDKVMTMWTNFAKSGNPGIEGIIDWKPYTSDNDRYLDIGSTLEMRTGLAKAFP